MNRLALALPLALCLALASCGNDGPPKPKTIEETTFAPSLGVDLKNSVKTDYGEYFRDLQVGTGAQVAYGQQLSVHYTGWLPDGTQFDSNDGSSTPFSFILGMGQVISGWDMGLLGANVGGTRQLVIPPELAYGQYGNGPIPPNAILVFTVHIDAAQ